MAESTDVYSSRAACKIALDCYRNDASDAEVEYKREKRRHRALVEGNGRASIQYGSS